MANPWGAAAMKHWQAHLPDRFAELEDPEAFFTQLGQEADERYLAIRDDLLEGVNPKDGAMDWTEFQNRVTQADQTAREIVETEMIYVRPESSPNTP